MFVGADIDKSWHFHYGAISRGDYPLDELPAHVRELAKRLYYTKEPANKKRPNE